MLPTGIHDDLTTDKARDIIRRLPNDILTVVITYVNQARQAADLVEQVGAGAIQFHGGISQTQIRLFRDLCPLVKTIGRVTVHNHSAILSSRRFRAPQWDAIILDSIDTNTGKRGATGLTHDWSISAKIVLQSSIPVILAGGLTPENVANAIRTVRPHAVDAHTGLEDEDGSRNYKKIDQFASIAREAFQAYVFSYIP